MVRITIRGALCIGLFLQPIVLSEVESQSVFLDSGSSGMSLAGGINLSDSGAGFGIDAGYSLAGLVDFGFGFGRYNYDDEASGGLDLVGTGFVPSMSFLMLKQSEYIPLSIKLGVGYGRSRVSGAEIERLELDWTGSSWILGLDLHSSMELTDGNILIPHFGVSHTNTQATIKDKYGDSVKNEGSDTSFDVGATFAFKLEDGGFVYLDPSVSMGEDETTFSFGVGMVFETNPQKRNRRPLRREPANTPGPWYGTPPGTPDPPPQSPEPTTVREPKAASEDLGRIGAEEIQAIKGKVSPLESVGADNLAYDQLKTISRIFKVPLSIINQFRWGKAMAPIGHPHHKTIYFTIEYGDDTFVARETIRIDSDGNVTERTKE
jgi:hypothetical protein